MAAEFLALPENRPAWSDVKNDPRENLGSVEASHFHTQLKPAALVLQALQTCNPPLLIVNIGLVIFVTSQPSLSGFGNKRIISNVKAPRCLHGPADTYAGCLDDTFRFAARH